jgi:hypothetical protein
MYTIAKENKIEIYGLETDSLQLESIEKENRNPTGKKKEKIVIGEAAHENAQRHRQLSSRSTT